MEDLNNLSIVSPDKANKSTFYQTAVILLIIGVAAVVFFNIKLAK